MGRVLIVFNSPKGSDHAVWKKLCADENPKTIADDRIYVLQSCDYRLDGDWDYVKIAIAVNAIKTTHNGSECAVLLHTQEPTQIDTLCESIQLLDITIQRFSTGRSPIHYENYIKSFCDAPNQEKFNALWDQIQKKSPDTLTNLIALSILCQGYLAANGGNGLDGWDKLPDELKKKASDNWSNLKTNWWEAINKKQAEKELADRDENKKVGDLLSQITSPTVEVDAVVAAYPVIKKILINK